MPNRLFRSLWFLLLLTGVVLTPVRALQQPDSVAVTPPIEAPPNQADAPNLVSISLSMPEVYLALGVLIFGLILIVLEFVFMKQLQISADNSVRLITVTLIVVSILFLIVGSYSDQQIAPATGLLGTIAGYLLGKTNTEQSGG